MSDNKGTARPIAIVLVAAVADNDVIGRDNKLPWRIKSDLKYFRSVTMNKPVVMGRKTYASIGRPLPGRTNIVVTRDRDFAAPGLLIVNHIDYALQAARGDALRRNADAIAIIGGTEIFNQTMAQATRLALTRVHAEPKGDTYFPKIDPGIWREIERSQPEKGPDDDYGFTFVTYERIGAS